MQEQWKKILDFPNYSVSNSGFVRNDRTGKIRALSLDTYGYPQTILTREGGIRKCAKVHRLVATAFIENPYNKPMINHIDGNKQNNSVNNLEWCTNQENQDHYWRVIDNEEHHKRRVESRKGKGLLSDNPNAKMVICVETQKIYNTLKEAEIDTGTRYTDISQVCHKVKGRKTAGGFHWEFVKEDI